MQLDKRILEGKKPLGVFDLEEAKEFIGQKGYFTDFENLDTEPEILEKIDDADDVYYPFYKQGDDNGFLYFLPAAWVGKETRPYSLDEWNTEFEFGEIVSFRTKAEYCGDKKEFCAMYLGYEKPLDGTTDTPGKGKIMLGNIEFSFQFLFDNFEIEKEEMFVDFSPDDL